MAIELRPGIFRAVLSKIAVQGDVRAAAALTEVAKMIEDRAVQSVSARSHGYRTPTPARRGGPPASISGTLAKSITHTAPKAGLAGWEIRVGPASGMFPPYSGRVDSARYAYYLEVSGAGKSRVRYPFLGAAFHAVAEPAVLTVFRAVFDGRWL